MIISTEGIRIQRLAITDEKVVEAILQRTRIGYLGLVDGDEPYVVPLNFVWHDESLYIHGALFGRKASLLEAEPQGTFTVVEDLGTIAHPVPAKTDSAYSSVMLFGRLAKVDDLQEATAALDAMLSKYVPGYYETPLHEGHVSSYVSSMGSHVGVYRLRPDKITAKQNPNEFERMFYPGRTRTADVHLDRYKKQSNP